MAHLPIYAFPLLGLFSGILCFGLLSHWSRLVMAALGKRQLKEARASAGARKSAAVFVAVHPFTWALVLGAPWGIFRVLMRPPPLPWLLFSIAVVVGVLLPAIIGIVAAMRLASAARRRAAVSKQTNAT
jgi:hypothetical protein